MCDVLCVYYIKPFGWLFSDKLIIDNQTAHRRCFVHFNVCVWCSVCVLIWMVVENLIGAWGGDVADEFITNHLSISDVPETRVRLGTSLEPDSIREGTDVYFDCLVSAHPAAYKVEWRHNVNIFPHIYILNKLLLAFKHTWDTPRRTHMRSTYAHIFTDDMRRILNSFYPR